MIAEADPESFDLMFPGIVRPLTQLRLDLNRDDYFAAPVALLRLEQSVFLTGPGAAKPPAGGLIPAVRMSEQAMSCRALPRKQVVHTGESRPSSLSPPLVESREVTRSLRGKRVMPDPERRGVPTRGWSKGSRSFSPSTT